MFEALPARDQQSRNACFLQKSVDDGGFADASFARDEDGLTLAGKRTLKPRSHFSQVCLAPEDWI